MDESKALALRDAGGALTPAALDALPAHARERMAQLIVRADEFRYYAGLAESMAKGNMLPKLMNAQGAAICMLEGQSLGFTELQSLKHLTCINNTVGLMNVGAVAILRTNGALKKGTSVEKTWFWEPNLDATIPQDGEAELAEGQFSRMLTHRQAKNPKAIQLSDEVFNSLGCRVTMHKKGHTKPFTDSFTIGDAKRLGKWGDTKSAWAGNPMRMLFNRAWGRILTDHFSEFTSGLRLESELRDDIVVDIDPAGDIGGVPVQVQVEDDGDPLGDMVAEAPEMRSDGTMVTDDPAAETTERVQEEQEGGAEEGEIIDPGTPEEWAALDAADPIEQCVTAEEILGDQSREGMGDNYPTERLPFDSPPFSRGEEEPDEIPPEAPTASVACPACMEPGDYEVGKWAECWNAECLNEFQLDDEGDVVISDAE